MNIELKDFQLTAVQELVDHLDSARYEAGKGKAQALSLASPTGSGKTVIATRLIEQVIEGDDEHKSDPSAIFLWLTDQPELNEQTRNKMLGTSSVLAPKDLVVIDAGLDEETLSPGRVYFLNTQKLGKNSSLVRASDERSFTLWETLTNTVAEHSTNFYLIVDEAHRGMQEGQQRKEANSIIQKFIKGSVDQLPAVPIIVAISATIARFDEVVANTGRVKRPVEVPIEDVRQSGLLKEAVNLFHPDEKQPSDMTMLREAARSWAEYRDRWSAYAKSEGETEEVEPVLLVQVQDGSEKKISQTNLGEVIAALTDELGQLPSEAFAHAFQEGSDLAIDSMPVRYLAPSAIDADPDVQIVFFKTSLNLGWDCPRAEVMMSFRAAKDDTLIAQLVGRMVRAPLTRSIDADEHLNTVALYLPHYDRKGLERVIKRLQADDPTTLPPTEIREGREVVQLTRRKATDQIFAKLESLPSYVIPKATITSQVRRLGKLATLLGRYGVDDDAPDTEKAALVDVLIDELKQRKASAGFKKVVKESGVLEVRAVEWRYDPNALPEKTIEIPISEENVNDLFNWAGRRLHEGLHKAYWKRRAADGAKNHLTTKLEAHALAVEQDVVDRLEKEAQARVQALLSDHAAAIAALPDGARNAFDEVRGLARDPEQTNPAYPNVLELAAAGDELDHHLFVDANDKFSFKTTTWEDLTLEEELARDDVVGWLRNPDRKAWSLCVPYEMGKGYKGCYPDFLIVRTVKSALVADIVDPHLLDFEDAWYRAKGLAKFAAKHAGQFGRIEMIRVEKGKVERIDLGDEIQRERVLKVSSNAHLRELFDS